MHRLPRNLLFGLLTACRAVDSAPVSSPPPLAVPEGAVRGWYTPDEVLTTFPDEAQTVADPEAPTGRRVALTPGAREDFGRLLPSGFRLLEPLEALDGFGLTAPVTLRFSAAVDPVSVYAAARLVNLRTGASVPTGLRSGADGATVFLEPLVPLQPATPYAVIVGEGAVDVAGGRVWPAEALRRQLWGVSGHAGVDALWALALETTGLGPEEVVAGTVFTTQSAFSVEEAARVVLDGVTPRLSPGEPCVPDRGGRRCEWTLDLVDLLGEDDRLSPGEVPAVQRSYSTPVSVWMPDPTEGPPGPWPVVVYAHGLGGGRWEGGGLAEQLRGLGFVVVALDAPRHHEHPTTTTDASLFWVLNFFGIDETTFSFDTEVLRDAWRRASWDKVQLVRALQAAPDLDGDGVPDVVPDAIHVVGHSLGGIMGVHLLADAPELRSAMLSVPGGRVSAIVQDSPTFAPLVALMAPDDTEPVDIERFFPVLQTVIDGSDPAVHAARAVDGHDVWQDMVIGDTIIPNESNRALARAIAGEHVAPVLEAVSLLPGPVMAPVTANIDGTTRVFTQADRLWDGEVETRVDHSDVFDHPARTAQLRVWLQTAEAGRAVLEAAPTPPSAP